MKKIILGFILLSVFASLIKGQDNDTALVFKFSIDKQIAAPIWRTTKLSLQEATKINADYVLIHMNTYGGMVDAADSIRTKILDCKIPVYVYIDNNAASAGALIAIACLICLLFAIACLSISPTLKHEGHVLGKLRRL